MQVRSQNIHLLHVQPSGKIVLMQLLGQHCHADDDLEVRRYEEQERRWQEQHGQVLFKGSGF